jgi:HD-GYP domain-containing protein (c-di-GMP phosphodiesterase class II)
MTILLLIAFGMNVTNIVTRPIRKLVQASSEVANGNLNVQVELHGNDEIALLTHSFNAMVSRLNHAKVELLEAYDKTLEGWSLALELRDNETEGHTRRVTRMTLDLAQLMGIEQNEMINFRRGALLHDIGKMGIPDSILLKPGKLTPKEWEVMRMHPVFAYQLISPIRYLHPALDIPYCHHERWDGSGYPRGLRNEEIPIAARIFAVVDVWDAMRSNRPYRQALPEDEACKYIRSAAGSHFDPLVVEAFFDLISVRSPAEEQG